MGELVAREEQFRVVRAAARPAMLGVPVVSEELARSSELLVVSEELRRVALLPKVSSAESLLPSVIVSAC